MKNDISRKSFLKYIISGIGFLLLSFVSSVTATIRFLFPNVLYEPSRIFKIGKPDNYTKGEPNFIEDKKVFLFKEEDNIYVISAVCTHLGCTVRWNDSENKFKCPCHGSIFSKDGKVIKGPAPNSLPWYEVTIAKDGNLTVNLDKPVGTDYRLKVQ